MQGMFENCRDLQSLNLRSFRTSKATNMASMFENCYKLTSIDISSTNFNTSNVTDMSRMFDSCRLLKNINFGTNFNTSNVTNMYAMFYGMWWCCKKIFQGIAHLVGKGSNKPVVTTSTGYPDSNSFNEGHDAISVERIPDQKKFCPYCGAKIQEDNSFCGKCGKPI